jgi:tetratricopeptide (TPR) repeat protein
MSQQSADKPKNIKELRAELEQAMQDREYARAAGLAESLHRDASDDAGYFRYLLALSHFYRRDWDAAAKALEPLLTGKQDPWQRKGRFLQAQIYRERKDYAAAEKIYAAEANYLHTSERKQEIARIYVDMAEAFARKPLPQELDALPPDYDKACRLYQKALDIKPGDGFSDDIVFRLAEIRYQQENWQEAQSSFSRYLQEYDTAWQGWPGNQFVPQAKAAGRHRTQARLRLAECLLAGGQPQEARWVLEDFLQFLTQQGDLAQKQELRQEALWQITRAWLRSLAREDVSAAVKSLRRYLQEFPAGSHSVEAAYDIAITYQRCGQSEEAMQTLHELLQGKGYEVSPAAAEAGKESPRDMHARLRKEATYALGQLYFARKEYAKAIEFWQAYTTQFTDGPRWAAAQKGVVDSDYQQGKDLVAARKYDEARSVWEKFLAKYPLDARSPRILYVFAQIKYQFAVDEQKRANAKEPRQSEIAVAELFRLAVREWDRLIAKYASSDESQAALFMCGRIHEEYLGELKTALEIYRRIHGQPWIVRAQERIARMTTPELVLKTPRIYRSDEEVRVAVELRNIPKLTVKIFRLNLEEYFRRQYTILGIESLDLNLIEANKSWEVDVANYSDYLPLQQELTIPMNGPGAYAVEVSSDKLLATTLVVQSDLHLLVKSSRREVLVFAQNMRENKPAAAASVLVSDGKKIVAQGVTNEQGVFLQKIPELKDAEQVSVLTQQQGHIAADLFSLSGLRLSQGLSAKGYIVSDRPVYQPGDTVNIRAILREVENGSYVVPHGNYRFSLCDPQGRCLLSEAIQLSPFGTTHKALSLSQHAAVGDYRIEFVREDKTQTFSSSFRVEHVRLEKIRLTLEFAHRVVFRGEKVAGTFAARYYYGTPVVAKTIRYTLPDNRALSGETDHEGKLRFTFDTTGQRPGTTLSFSGVLIEDNVSVSEQVKLAEHEFTINIKPARPRITARETVELTVLTKDVNDKPRGALVKLTLYREVKIAPDPVLAALPWTRQTQADDWGDVADGSSVGEVKLEEKEVTTDAPNGIARLSFQLPTDGNYVVRGQSQDRFANTVTGQASITAQRTDDAKLRLTSERQHVKMGEKFTVDIQANLKPSPALVTCEGETIIAYRVVTLKEGVNPLTLDISHAYFPNFQLSVAVLGQTEWFEASRAFTVERELKLQVKFAKPHYQPGEKAEVRIKASDHLGRPVCGEMSLALVDEALFAAYRDPRTPIVPFFQTEAQREAALRSGASCTFRYEASTREIVQESEESSASDLARLLLRVDGPRLAYLHKALDIKIVVTNQGNNMARNVAVVATLPRHLDYINARPGGIFRPAKGEKLASVSWRLAAIPPGGQTEISLEVRTKMMGRCRLGVFMSGNQQQAFLEIESIGIPAMHISTYDTEDPVEVGKTTVYVTEVRNEGTSNCTVMVITARIPEQMELVKAEGPGVGYRLAGRNVVFDAVPVLPPGEKLTYKVLCRCLRQGSAKYAATLTYNEFARPITDEEGSSVYNGDTTTTEAGEKTVDKPDIPNVVEKSLDSHDEFGGEKRETKGVNFKLRSDFEFDAGIDPDQLGLSLPPARQEIEGVSWWLPALVTDAQGEATADLTMPEKTSEWRLTAIGCTVETLVGECQENIVTRRDFFADLKLPQLFIEGDTPRFVARIHNLSDYAGPVDLLLEVAGDENPDKAAGPMDRLWELFTGDNKKTQARQITVAARATTECVFDKFTVPATLRLNVRLTASVPDKALCDALVRTVPVRPWGMPYAAHTSGQATGDATLFLTLPERHYTSSWLNIVIGPSVNRTILDMALNATTPGYGERAVFASLPSELMAVGGALLYAKESKCEVGDYEKLLARARTLAIALIASQNKDGGWGLVPGQDSQPVVSARALWALAQAREAGIAIAPELLDHATGYLESAFTKLAHDDDETKALLQYALSLLHKSDFAVANRLYRQRDALSSAGLAYTVMLLANDDKQEMAGELLDFLSAQKRRAASGRNASWAANEVETTALVLLAFMAVRPDSPLVRENAERLLALRQGMSFVPYHSHGTAVAALSRYHARARYASSDYRLEILVNDKAVSTLIGKDDTPTAYLEVPPALIVAGRNKIECQFQGSGCYTYAATLYGFSQDMADPKSWEYPYLDERVYRHMPLTYQASSIGVGSTTRVANLEAGQMMHVCLIMRTKPLEGEQPTEPGHSDYLMVEESMPAGMLLMRDSVRGNVAHYAASPGKLLFYFSPQQPLSHICYELVAYAPGRYRTLPTAISDGHDPSRLRLGQAGEITVLAPGERSSDEYFMNNDELYALGSRYFNDNRYVEALSYLAKLAQQMPTHNQREVARMLLWIYTEEKHYDAARVVEVFEILKEKFPELYIPFAKILQVQKAYRDMREYERAYLVAQATIEASFVEECKVAAVLEEQGQILAASDYLRRLWRDYHDSANVTQAYFAMSQSLYARLSSLNRLQNNMRLGSRSLKQSTVTREQVLQEITTLLRQFLAVYPQSQQSDQAAFSLASTYLARKQFAELIAIAHKAGELYQASTLVSTFAYMEALGHFARHDYAKAIAAAEPVANGNSKDSAFATYVLGQIYHAQDESAQALLHYRRISDRFPDAREAIAHLEGRALRLPEIKEVRPGDKVELELCYRNIRAAQFLVYRVDLMKLCLRHKDIAKITEVHLSGIKPVLSQQLTLGEGKDYRDMKTNVSLPFSDEGAYLVLCRGDDLFTTGLVLITPLKLEVDEDAESQRVRAYVVNQVTKKKPEGIRVAVIGSGSEQVTFGETDLRGIATSDNIVGKVTLIARSGERAYAFYRGDTWLGPKPERTGAGSLEPIIEEMTKMPPKPSERQTGATLEESLDDLNREMQKENMEKLEKKTHSSDQGVLMEDAY